MATIGKSSASVIRQRHVLVAVVSLIALATPASANAGIPTIFLVAPALACTIVPIVLIEWWFLVHFAKAPLWRALATAFATNTVSTIVGVPLAWVATSLLYFVIPDSGLHLTTMARAFFFEMMLLSPYEDIAEWQFLLGVMAMNLVFFWLSVVVERRLSLLILDECDRAAVRRAVSLGNVATYGCLQVLLFLLLLSVVKA